MAWPKNCARRNEPLAKHTSFRIGGPAEWFARPTTLDDLVDVLREAHRVGLPISIVGGGTNTLAPDRGIHGLVVALGTGFGALHVKGIAEDGRVRVRCGAMVPTTKLVGVGAQAGWQGMEQLAGLPGQVGGAVAMNAQWIGNFVQEVVMVSWDGSVKRITRDHIRFAYRYSDIPQGIIVEVELAFAPGDAAAIAASVDQVIARRNATQDVGFPSAGCAFRNPPQAPAAGRLIQQAGLKGNRIGDAAVSLRHANFIVNLGFAKAEDVLSLMEHVQRQVRRYSGIQLEPELRVLGNAWK